MLVVLLQTWASSFFATFSWRCLAPKTLLPSLEAANKITRNNPSCHFEITMAFNSFQHNTYRIFLSMVLSYPTKEEQANQRVLCKFMYIYMHMKVGYGREREASSQEEEEKYGGDKCVKVAGSVGKGLIKILSIFWVCRLGVAHPFPRDDTIFGRPVQYPPFRNCPCRVLLLHVSMWHWNVMSPSDGVHEWSVDHWRLITIQGGKTTWWMVWIMLIQLW